MIKVLLDTNILHQEGLNSTRFQVLKRLIHNKTVGLIIPEIVIEEYKSKKIDQATEELKKIQSAIDQLERKDILNKWHNTSGQFCKYVSSEINLTSQIVDSWLEENQVKVYPIAETSIEELFAGYFAGTGAFRKKNRNDFPDAVIHDCILKLSKDESVIVVLKDGALSVAISKLEGVCIYESLSEVLEVPLLKETLVELNAGEKKVKLIIDVLEDYSSKRDVEAYLQENDLIKAGGAYNEGFVKLPYDLDELKKYSAQIKCIEYVDMSVATYLGDGKFSYWLNAECEAVLSFTCENEFYESLPYEYRKALHKSELSVENEAKVEGVVKARLQGDVILHDIDEDTDSNQLKVHLSYLGAEQSNILCEVNWDNLDVDEIN